MFVFLKFLLEYSCFTMLCQFLAVQQNESVIHIHISPLFWISFPLRSPQSTEQSSLCYTVGSHQLSILYIVSIVYISQSQSPNLSHPTPFLLGIHTFVLYVCVSISVNNIEQSSLCYTVGLSWLSILYIVVCVHVNPRLPTYPSPSPSPPSPQPVTFTV